MQSANSGASQRSVSPPPWWAFWASFCKKLRWSWTPAARCPSWRWTWRIAPHSGWWRKGQHLCRQPHSGPGSYICRSGVKAGLSSASLTSCTVLVLQPLWFVHVHVGHNLRVPKEGAPTSDFWFVLHQFPVGGGTAFRFQTEICVGPERTGRLVEH